MRRSVPNRSCSHFSWAYDGESPSWVRGSADFQIPGGTIEMTPTRNTKLDRALLLSLYRNMVLIREFELKAREVFRTGRMPGFIHVYIGEEAVATGVCAQLRIDDYVASTHRGHGGASWRGDGLFRWARRHHAPLRSDGRLPGIEWRRTSGYLDCIWRGTQRQAKRYRPGGCSLLRRRGIEQRRLPRRFEPGRGLGYSSGLCLREQSLCDRDAFLQGNKKHECGQPRRSLRDAWFPGGWQQRARRVREGRGSHRASSPGRRPNLVGVSDLSLVRPSRGRPWRGLSSERGDRGLEGAGPGEET